MLVSDWAGVQALRCLKGGRVAPSWRMAGIIVWDFKLLKPPAAKSTSPLSIRIVHSAAVLSETARYIISLSSLFILKTLQEA